MAEHGGSDIGLSHEAAAGSAQPVVVLSGCGAIGLHCATVLIDAGYAVYGMNVDDALRESFLHAGGQLVTCGRRTLRSASWIIECVEQADPAPEVLSGIVAHRSGYRRPRVELAGSRRAATGPAGLPAAQLTLRSAASPGASLIVELGVTPRGPELNVRGDRQLFERALPLLTTISDRVVYSSTSPETHC